MSRFKSSYILSLAFLLVSHLALAGQSKIATRPSHMAPFTKAMGQLDHRVDYAHDRFKAGQARARQIRGKAGYKRTTLNQKAVSPLRIMVAEQQQLRRLKTTDLMLAWSDRMGLAQSHEAGTMIDMINLSIDDLSLIEQQVFDHLFLRGRSINESARRIDFSEGAIKHSLLDIAPLFIVTQDDLTSFEQNAKRHSLLEHPSLTTEGYSIE